MKFLKSLVKGGGGSSRGRGRRGCDSKIVNLTRQQKWDSILKLLDEHGSEALEDKGTASVHLTYEEYNGGNILHIMCEYHPPSRLVNRVASMFPLLTIQVNSRRQTPLHVAASCGASHRVISTLLKHGGTSPCIMQDTKGYTPLHLHIKHCTPQKQICDPGWSASTQASSNDSHSQKHSKLVAGPDLKVLRLLAEAAPQAINMSDNEGHLPSDLASHHEGSNSRGGHPTSSPSSSNTNKRGSMVAQAASHIMSRSQFIEFAKSATSHTSSSTSNRTQMTQQSSSNRSLTHSTTAAA